MSSITNHSSESLLAAVWRFLRIANQRYDAGLIGESLMVMTLVILDRDGHQPTVSELADIIGIRKSNISRYIAGQMKSGHVQEIIDPKDRRRRLLHPTDKGRQEIKWLSQQLSDSADATGAAGDMLPGSLFSTLLASEKT